MGHFLDVAYKVLDYTLKLCKQKKLSELLWKKIG